MAIFYGRKGKSYNLNKLLGQGGEGDVYTIEGSADLVGKIYNDIKFKTLADRDTQERKLNAMINKNLSANVQGVLTIAWPKDLLYDTNHEFVGYVMPKVENRYPLYRITRTGPDGVLSVFPKYSYDNSILIAHNLALVVRKLHQANIIVGDFNPNNILVNKLGHVTLIDADSFTIKDDRTGEVFECTVGVPEYLAPELQGRNLGSTRYSFSKETDEFALAIHVFTLLANNCHPFGCKVQKDRQSSYSMSPKARNIVKGKCPYVSGSKELPPAYAPNIDFFPQEIRNLIDRTFTYTTRTAVKPETLNRRATAQEWENELRSFFTQFHR